MEEYAVEFYKKHIEPESFLSTSSTMPQLGENKDGLDDFELLNVETRKNLDPETSGSFRMTDAQWEDFVKFAAQKKFDHRSSAEVVFDQMIREAKAEGLYEKDKEAYDLLASKVKLSKEEVLNLYRDEIQPLMEEEIIHKYAFTAPRIRHMLDYDVQLWRAVAAWK